MGKVTIQSMAKDLGLSRNTISLALKNSELVTSRTKQVILQYAREVGYLPSEISVEKETGLHNPEENSRENVELTNGNKQQGMGGYEKEQTLGLELMEENKTDDKHRIMILRKTDIAVYWDKVISGISAEAGLNGCQTQVAIVTEEAEQNLILPTGIEEGIRAVFCVQLFSDEYVAKICQKGIWLFFLDERKSMGSRVMGDMVKMEGVNAMVALTQHLIDQGMKQIGFLSENSSRYETMYDRYDGYRYAIRRAGLSPDPSLIVADPTYSFFYRSETFEDIIDHYAVMPEAVVCGNDSIAMFLTQALRKKGYRVPEDVAVTGFDNDEEGMLEPFFSTVYVNPKWLGRRMVQSFLWRIRYPDAPYEKIMVEGKVILRKSSVKK